MKAVNENVMAAHHRKALAEISEDIATLQADIERLTSIRDGLIHFYGGDTPVEELLPATSLPDRSAVRTPGSRNGGGRSRRPTPDTNPSVVKDAGIAGRGNGSSLDLDKPDTLAGAMKQLCRTLSQPFTMESLMEGLRADKDFAKLLEQAGASSPSGNLAYWVKTGKLTRDETGAYRNMSF